MIMKVRTVAGPLAAALVVAGCFHYVPVADGAMPEMGQDVRAVLDPPRAFHVGVMTLNQVSTVEGTLVEASPDSLGLSVTWFRPDNGERFFANRAGYFLSRGNIQRLDAWRVSPRRTVLAVGLTAGIMTGLVALIREVITGSDIGGDNKGPITQ